MSSKTAFRGRTIFFPKFAPMDAKRNKPSVVRATDSGRLYVRPSDFFRQADVQSQIKRLKGSFLYRGIIDKKR